MKHLWNVVVDCNGFPWESSKWNDTKKKFACGYISALSAECSIPFSTRPTQKVEKMEIIKAFNFLEVGKFTNCSWKGHFAKRAN